MNSKIRACREDDLFCWPLAQIVKAMNYSRSTSEGQVKICELFSITSAEHEGDCWKGQVSSMTKGKPSRKVDYTYQKPKKAKKPAWWRSYSK